MPLFKVQLVGLAEETPVYNGMFSVHADELIKNIDRTDLIIIPALGRQSRCYGRKQQGLYSLDHQTT